MGPLPQVTHLCTRNPEETQALGSILGKAARPGDIYLLTGDLGAGKTCLTQGIAWGLGVAEHAFSPSFVLVREYSGRLPLYHMDLYRLERAAEIADLGLDDYFYGKGVCVVEWADRCLALMPPEHMIISIAYVSEAERGIRLTSSGERYSDLRGKVFDELEASGWNCLSIPPQT